MTYETAVAKAAAICSRAEHCEVEIDRKLRQWGAAPDTTKQVIDWLVDNNFIDNARYAHAFVYDKSRFDMWGRIKISHQLRQNGIPNDVIEEAMKEIDGETYAENFRTLLKAKARTVTTDDHYKARASLMRYAASRGYEHDLASKLINEITDCDEDIPETDDEQWTCD